MQGRSAVRQAETAAAGAAAKAAEKEVRRSGQRPSGTARFERGRGPDEPAKPKPIGSGKSVQAYRHCFGTREVTGLATGRVKKPAAATTRRLSPPVSSQPGRKTQGKEDNRGASPGLEGGGSNTKASPLASQAASTFAPPVLGVDFPSLKHPWKLSSTKRNNLRG